MNQILSLIRLEPLAGMRSQITALIAVVLNVLVSTGILKWTPEELDRVNQVIIFLFGYFFAEKMSKK